MRRITLRLGLLATLLGAGLLGASACNRAPRSDAPPSPAPTASALPQRPEHEVDERPEAYTDKRRVIARIQSNLERAAAGAKPVPLPDTQQPDALEAVVAAYSAVMANDRAAMDRVSAIEAEAKKRFESAVSAVDAEGGELLTKKRADYVRRIDEALKVAGKEPDAALIRLAVTLRMIDAALLLEHDSPGVNGSYELFDRMETVIMSMTESYRDDVWLRLPCRTVIGRAAALERARALLGPAGVRLVGCPVPPEREGDFAFMERFARDPAGAAADAAALVKEPQSIKPPPEPPKPDDEGAPPKPPWDLAAAIAFMDIDPDAAEKPIAKAATKPAGKLDYALFLHAFRPPSKARDARIARIMSELDRASRKAADFEPEEELTPVPYNGTDESLVPSLRLASETGVANTRSAFYAIPCAVLIAKPALLAAAEPMFGGNRDNFLPRSGCSWGRGSVRGFPDAELAAWGLASQVADGNFYINFRGTLRYGLAAAQMAFREQMKLNPRQLLNEDEPPIEEPYETWSYMSLTNREEFIRQKPLVKALRDKLIAFYKKAGLSEDEATRAAKRGIFGAVWGADCGKARPSQSLRRLLINGAPVAEIRAFIESGEHLKAANIAPFNECRTTASMDPLMHVAVGHPAALRLLWEKLHGLPLDQAGNLDLMMDVDAPNEFGKTPLMTAAQFDHIESARFLLSQGARVNRDTFQKGYQPLAHDARTALMYAASRGSLAMIKLLLDAGADPHKADTRGRKPLHYLLGYGPVRRNPKLSPTELGEAAKLLL